MIRVPLESLFLALAAIVPLLAQQHAGEYAQADIQYGATVYASQCTNCHGPIGDRISGVNLPSGRFRNASSEDDLRRLILLGIPGTSMPGRQLDTAQMTSLIAYLRNMRDFNGTAVALGEVAAKCSSPVDPAAVVCGAPCAAVSKSARAAPIS